MTCFAVRVSAVYHKSDIVICKYSVSGYAELASSGGRGVHERVAAFGAEEMLFVIGSFTQRWVIQADKTFFNNSGFAMIAFRCEILEQSLSAQKS
jgi:hypothetical protein